MTVYDLGEVTDAGLIEAVRRGQTAAEGELFVRHQDAAVRYARRLAGTSDAEDLVADAFVKVFEVIRDARGPEVAFRPYLMTAVRNRHVDHVRKDSRHVWISDEGVLDAVSVPGDERDLRDESEVLAAAFHSLPERHQLVLWHALVEKDPHSVTAQLLGMSANGVAALTYRAKESLREAYLARHVVPTTDKGCGPTRELLSAHRRGRLPRKLQAQVDQHLEGCPACADAFGELAMLDSRLAAMLPAALLFVPVAASIVGGVTVAPDAAPRMRRPAVQAVLAGTAAVTAVIVAIWWAGAGEDRRTVAATPAVPAVSVPPPTSSPSVMPSATIEPTVVAGPSAVAPVVPVPTPAPVPTTTRPSPRVPPESTGGRRSVAPVAPVPVTPQRVDLAVRSLTAYSAGSGRYVVEADVVAASSAPRLTFAVVGMTAFEVKTSDTGRSPSCSSTPSASPDLMTVLCVFDGPADGRTTLAVELAGHTLDARVALDDASADDPRPGNNTARVLIDELAG
ncbi:sigma-70 family RNA polymerase sigma factor [Aeromicrobium fastidiosum]|uniref:Sigma-70 family RNA polymerase sigma factor n=1 Tax=Aeromicrobium fastidiosum TaxID=52699 RepID=A0A641AQU9_9ACTN|nr:sigma-70 family RNA polymerase sigma factor [Aeromicrobium fastidiosum]KAA1380484.1 sigma-70 family RNA polymerase sigma factor [Aeromicrobium fastidiosum]MBP2390073.1 RNA polymerase sigma factor (sigma-70 family) [Aeromicrobium fastidiosum]